MPAYCALAFDARVSVPRLVGDFATEALTFPPGLRAALCSLLPRRGVEAQGSLGLRGSLSPSQARP